MSEKSEFDWALVSCAAAARVGRDGQLTMPRVALGAISPVPHTSEEANNVLKGKRVEEGVEACVESLLSDAETRPDNAYKLPLARSLVRRVLEQLGSV